MNHARIDPRPPFAIGLLSILLLAGNLSAEVPSISLDSSAAEWIERDHPLTLVVTEWPPPESGRLALVLGDLDLTDLFRRDSDRLIYRPELMPLPRGESELVVYLVDPAGEWKEISRHPVRVLQPGGFETLTLRPTLDLEVQANHDPNGGDNQDGDTQTRATGQFRLESSARRQGLGLDLQVGVLGVSERQDALRHSSEGDSAPQIDLSSYLLSVSLGEYQLELGHLSVGQSRQFLSGFSSRGLSIATPLGSRTSLRMAAVNGTQIVGWNNPFGLAESRHRLYSVSVGTDLLSRPGGLRLDGTWLDASILPLSNFDQGNLEDREESSGWSLSLQTSTASSRLMLRGGFSRSTFTNPDDPLLNQGDDLVTVSQETRDAQFLEVDLNLLQATTGDSDLPISIDLALRHQRVDPLYRSIGAFVASDIEENGGELRTTFGGFSAQLAHTRSHDNLDDIPSILETKTRQDTGVLFLPLPSTVKTKSGGESQWLPALSYTYGRTHQFSDTLPINGGFSLGHLPDQVSLSHAVSMDWQGNLWRMNVTGSWSDQDNRQPGRENDDFAADTSGISFSLTPHTTLDLAISLSDEESQNLASRETDTTRRAGLNVNWRLHPSHSFELMASRSRGDSSPRLRKSRSTDFTAQWSWQFARTRPGSAQRNHGFSSRFHLLYARQAFEAEDLVFGFAESDDRWTVSAGLSLSFF